MLIRSWNLRLGKQVRAMVELLTADRPGIVCLQEVPAWALPSVGEWAGMQAVTARTRAPKAGILPAPGTVGKHFGKGGGGEGNAILFPKEAKLRQEKTITLNTNPFCEEQAGKLGLNLKQARAWEHDRRVCHIAKIELPNRRRILIANIRATDLKSDRRLADAEIRRAVTFVDRQAETEETVIFAGDFNIRLQHSLTLQELTGRLDETYSPTGPALEHILVRGDLVRRIAPTALRVWPEERRLLDGKPLSDHAPVELDIPDPKPRSEPVVEEPAEPKLPTLAEAQRAAPLEPEPAPATPPPVAVEPPPDASP
jgi:endonuclease/exonuclease/phosphatase family metal-dependent hydrolase